MGRHRQVGGGEYEVACPETFGTACPRANKQWHKPQKLSWGRGGSLAVVASTDAGSVESEKMCRDTELCERDATASESSEKQCLASTEPH